MTPPRDSDDFPELPDGWEVTGYIDRTRPIEDWYVPGEVTQHDLDQGYSVRVHYVDPQNPQHERWFTINGPIDDYDEIWDMILDLEGDYF